MPVDALEQEGLEPSDVGGHGSGEGDGGAPRLSDVVGRARMQRREDACVISATTSAIITVIMRRVSS